MPQTYNHDIYIMQYLADTFVWLPLKMFAKPIKLSFPIVSVHKKIQQKFFSLAPASPKYLKLYTRVISGFHPKFGIRHFGTIKIIENILLAY